MKIIISVLSVVYAFQFVPIESAANTLNVLNPSFEEYRLDDDEYTTYGGGLVGYGWSVLGTGQYVGIWNTTKQLDSIPDGRNVAYSHGETIAQVLSDKLSASLIYTLQVEIGRAKNNTFGGCTIQLLAENNLLAEKSRPPGPEPDPGKFIKFSVSYSAEPDNPHLGLPLEIRLLTKGKEALFDRCYVDTNPVPIPNAAWLFGTGLIAFFCLRRKIPQ